MKDLISALLDKGLAFFGTIILMVIPPIRKFLYRWPLESAVIISTVLSASIMYMTVIRFTTWPGDPTTFDDPRTFTIGTAGNPDKPNWPWNAPYHGDGWGNLREDTPFYSRCPAGSYAVGIKWFGLANGTNCDRCAVRIQVLCKPLATPPQLKIQ